MKRMQYIENMKNGWKEKNLIILGLFMCFFMCFLHAISAGEYADFFPINGTFQNYNPVRRLLSGQIPGRDFYDYLGMGHLYIGAIATFFFGNDYKSSLIAFSFLSVLSFALIGMLISGTVFRNRTTAVFYVDFILVMLLTQNDNFLTMLTGTDDVKEALNMALYVGNSARYIRGMILPISVCLLLIGYKCYLFMAKEKWTLLKYKNMVCACGIGVVAGISFVWSNDFGISSWVCWIIMTFWIFFSRTRHLKKTLGMVLIEFIFSLISIFITVEVITLGHFTEWLNFTFGTGGYQKWYYNSSKSYYIYEVDFSYMMLVQAFVCIIYLIRIYQTKAERQAILRYGIPAYANMVSFCMVNEYRLLSGNFAREVALAVLFLTVVSEVFRCIIDVINRNMIQVCFTCVVFVLSVSWCISRTQTELIKRGQDKEGTYVAEMGGNMTSLAEDLLNTQRFLNGEKIFSTYASGQEVMEGIFQPSGIDYIIHVLGDKQREDYLSSFKTEDFKYAATMKEEFTPYEYWIERANWFFYRELYRDWHPVYSNSYEKYWVRNKEGEIDDVLEGNYSVVVEDVNDSAKRIVIETNGGENGIAELYIDYSVKKKDSLRSKMLISTLLRIENVGTTYAEDVGFETNFIKDSGVENIPVTLVGGHGEVLLTSMPAECTYLELNDIQCNSIYPVTFNYIEVNSIIEQEGSAILNVLNNKKNNDILKDSIGLNIEETIYSIIEINEQKDVLSIVIDTSDNNNLKSEVLSRNNNFCVVR